MTLPIETNDPTVPAPVDIDADAETIASTESPGWTSRRKDGIETFTRPDGRDYVRARSNEGADLIVTYPHRSYLPPLRLVDATSSVTVRAAERKARREARELRKRGYDV